LVRTTVPASAKARVLAADILGKLLKIKLIESLRDPSPAPFASEAGHVSRRDEKAGDEAFKATSIAGRGVHSRHSALADRNVWRSLLTQYSMTACLTSAILNRDGFYTHLADFICRQAAGN
jgi:hypothetical protein